MSETETINLEESDVEFPDLHQGWLDEQTLGQYIRDLEQVKIFDVLVKGAPETYAEEGTFDLAKGLELFESGLVRGLQIRYLWNGSEWWDTLIRGAQGVRIVRVAHDWDSQ